jgi:hypothetical protein
MHCQTNLAYLNDARTQHEADKAPHRRVSFISKGDSDSESESQTDRKRRTKPCPQVSHRRREETCRRPMHSHKEMRNS